MFAGYIAYCAQQKIISGYTDGTFRPAATLSGYAFMKMLLGALGYDSQIEGFTGGNWTINVAKLVSNLGLADGNDEFAGTAAVTREQASLYAFNTLQADIVEYETKNTVTINGQVVGFGSDGKAKAMKWQNSATRQNNIKEDEYVQFAEQYFNKLVKEADATNAFCEPSTKWTWKGSKIGTYTDTPDVTYSTNVKLGQIYEDLGMSEKDKDAKVFINGVAGENVAVSKNNATKIASDSGNNKMVGDGSRVHVYYDDDTNSVTICVIDVYAGVVNSIVTKVADPYIVVESYSVIKKIDNDPYNIAGTETHFETDTDKFEEDDIVLFTLSQKDGAGKAEIKDVWTPESVTGETTKWVLGKSLELDNTTTYKYSKNIGFLEGGTESGKEKLTTANDYNLYLDEFGYVIYVEEEEFNPDDMAFVLYTQEVGSVFSKDQVKMVTASGKVLTVDTDDDYSPNGDNDMTGKVVYYRKNSDGLYALREITTYNNGTDADPAAIRPEGAVKAWAQEYKDPNDSGYDARKNDNTKLVYNNLKPVLPDGTAQDGSYATGVAYNGSTNFLMKDNNATIVVNDAGDEVRANSETVFVVAETNKKGNTTYTAYKGIKNAPSIASDNTEIDLKLMKATVADGSTSIKASDVTNAVVDAFWTIRSNRLVGFMFIDATNANVTSGKSSVVFLAGKESVSKQTTNYDNKEYYTYNAVVDGEITTVNVLTSARVDGNKFAGKGFNGVYTRMEVDGKGFVKGFEAINPDDYEVIADNLTVWGDKVNADVGKDGFNDTGTTISVNYQDADGDDMKDSAGKWDTRGVWKLSGKYTVGLGGSTSGKSIRYTVDEAAMIYFIDKSGEITKLDGTSQITSDATSQYIALLDKDTGDIKYLFIQEWDNSKKEDGTGTPTDEDMVVRVNGKTLTWSWNKAEAVSYTVVINEIIGGASRELSRDTGTFAPAVAGTISGSSAVAALEDAIYSVSITETVSGKLVASGSYKV